jgi:hypothetical protein
MEKFFRHPWRIVAVIGAITVFFVLQLPNAQLDNNNFRFVPDKDPERILTMKIDETFGSQILVLVGLERRSGTVFDRDFLLALRDFDAKVGELDIVDSVSSIVSTDYIDGLGDSVIVSPLIESDFSGKPEEISGLKEKLLGWDMYRRALISDDFTATQVVVALGVGTDDAGSPATIAGYEKIRALADSTGFRNTNVYFAGLPVISAEVNVATKKDLFFLVPLVIVVVVGVLFLSFKRLSSVLIPLLTVAISAIWAIGAMPLFGVKLSILSTVLPVILVAVGSAYGIHVVSHHYDEAAKKKHMDLDEHRLLVFASMRRIGWPVFLAALTTFVGFVSFCFTSVVPIFEFGIFSSFGVAAAFIVSMTLIPALFIIRGPEKAKPKSWGKSIEHGSADSLSDAIADSLCLIARKRRTTLAVGAGILFLSFIGVSRLVIDNVLVEYFKPYTEVARADAFVREKFGGSKMVNVVVEGEKPGDVLAPEVLVAMDGLARYLADYVPEVGKTTGFTDMVKRINQVMHADADSEGVAPRRLAAEAGNATSEGIEPAFGFGSLGSFEEIAEIEPAAKIKPAQTSPAGESGKPLSEDAFAEYLSKALALADRRDLSAEDLTTNLKKAMNYKGAAYYEIPSDPVRYGFATSEELKGLVSNYLVLLSGDIGAFADDPLEPKSICMNVQLRTVGQRDTDRALEKMRTYVADNFPKNVKVIIGGTALVEKSLNNLVVQSQFVSLVVSLVLVFLILSIYYRSLVAGFIGLAPLSISILINFAVMGWAGIKLNIGTAMVASIAIGVGIDYTIHYMAAYHNEFLLTGGKGDFLRRTFRDSGKVILMNAISVGLGFAVLALSQFNILADLGKLILLTMATSSVVSLTLLPVLLNVLDPAFIRRPLPSDKNSQASMEVSK